MDTPKAFDGHSNGDEERLSTRENVRKAPARPACHSAAAFSCGPQQGLSQRGQIAQLILAMAALRLDNKRTEEMVKREYEVVNPMRTVNAPQHVMGLDGEYVFVDG